MIVDEATAAKVDYLDLTAGVRPYENILRLEVTMDQLEIVDEGKCAQDLFRDLLEAGYVEIHLLLHFPIVLRVLVQVVSEQLCHDEEMLFVVEEIDQLEQILLVQVIAVGIDIPKKLDLVDRLVEVVLVVFYNLHAHHLLGVDVVALDSF